MAVYIILTYVACAGMAITLSVLLFAFFVAVLAVWEALKIVARTSFRVCVGLEAVQGQSPRSAIRWQPELQTRSHFRFHAPRRLARQVIDEPRNPWWKGEEAPACGRSPWLS